MDSCLRMNDGGCGNDEGARIRRPFERLSANVNGKTLRQAQGERGEGAFRSDLYPVRSP